MTKFASSLYFALGLLTVSEVASARTDFDNFSFVGVGATVGEAVFSDAGTQVGAEPYLFHHSQYGFINGTLANYAVLPWLGLSGHLRVAEVSDDFNDIPSGISNRDSSGELGLTLGTLGARITYLQDVSDVHDGHEIQLHLGHAFETPAEALSLSPYVQVNYRDSKLSEHLYNISESEAAASGLPSFQAEETWVYEGGVIALYEFSERILGISKLELEHHDSPSPLLQDKFGWSFGLGVAYQF